MKLTLEQSCPSCGASIIVSEDDRLIRCEYCSTNNYKCGGASGRYSLPYQLPANVEKEELVFAPYLRFKGAVYFVKNEGVQYKLIDTTRRGFENLESVELPVSLGLRPQALKLIPVISSQGGRFMQQTIATRKIFIHAANLIDIFNAKSSANIFHRAFIGETVSRIYQPLYVYKGCYYDAVLGRAIGPCDHLDSLLKSCDNSRSSWEPKFVSTFCPHCGGILEGESDSVVLGCLNCDKRWTEEGGRFKEIPWSVVKAGGTGVTYLPFWVIRTSAEGCDLDNLGDFMRFTNQPISVAERYENAPLRFWIPAFKINPKAFLQISTQLTLSQLKIPLEKSQIKITCHPVTLEKSEAGQAIKSVMASATVSRRKMYPNLKRLAIKSLKTELMYLPFKRKSHDLIQMHTNASVQTAAIRYGRSL